MGEGINRISSRHARWRSRPERARALGAKSAKEEEERTGIEFGLPCKINRFGASTMS